MKVTPKEAKALYMESPYVEWVPFAKSRLWDPIESKKFFSPSLWIIEKRKRVKREKVETLAESVFHHQTQWHEDVLKSLRELPEFNEQAIRIVKVKMNQLIHEINHDDELRKAGAAKAHVPRKFEKRGIDDMVALASAVSMLTASKQKALLMNDWSSKIAEQLALSMPEDEEQSNNTAKTIYKVKGADDYTPKQLQESLASWYDGAQINESALEVEGTEGSDGEGS